MRVVVIPEDFRKDQYILKPIIEAMFKALGRGQAKVVICTDPLLGGVGEALKWERIEEAIERYRTADLFILCVDRDGRAGRRTTLDGLERQAGSAARPVVLLAENAWQELEVWALAGHDLPSGWSWAEVREETNPKEIYFTPFARDRGQADGVAGGRKRLAEEAAVRYNRIRQLCPQDVGNLHDRIEKWLANHA